MNVIAGFGSAPTKKRGSGYSGADSTRPRQRVECADRLWGNLPGGSAPGGTVGVPLDTRQALAEIPSSRANANDMPAHMTGTHRATKGKSLADDYNKNPADDTNGPIASNGRHRGELPMILRQSRAPYRN